MDIKTKSAMVDYIAQKTDFSKKDVKLIIDTMIDFFAETLKADNSVQLMGFGSLIPRMRASRECKVPMTGETYTVPEKKMIKFKVNKTLLERIQ